MIFFLSFLLSWLSGFLSILLAAFLSYETFSIVDITSFAVFTFAGSLIIIPVIYLLVLKWIKKKVISKKQFIWFPASLILLGNLPVYFMIWIKTNDLYGENEALLFYLCFFTTALVFGLLWAWRSDSVNRES